MGRHKQHNALDLENALEHVIYEMWKYKQSVTFYGEIVAVGGDAAIEFRVLHHRVLLEFFYGPPKHPDNVVAWEYVRDWSRTHDRGSLAWLDAYLTRCHTLLAHISVQRSTIQRQGLKSWGGEWPQIETHLDQAISDFLGGLSPDHTSICLQWISKWSNGPHVGKCVLKDLAMHLEVKST